jgi:hypothetical protein
VSKTHLSKNWLGFVPAFLLSVTPLYLQYSLRNKTTPAPQMPDVQLNEAALSAWFFL